jgi:hypothetical protein
MAGSELMNEMSAPFHAVRAPDPMPAVPQEADSGGGYMVRDSHRPFTSCGWYI